MKELEKVDQTQEKIIDCDADKEEPEADKKDDVAKDDSPVKEKEGAKEVSATKEACEMYGIKTLFDTQSKQNDTCPSVIKDIPLSKMQ